ncbi:DUF1080 domain-containing protein [Aliifodinibius sp. S!AR15-10]|uniref:3-keto-disaccharide hydrolase n=1 Tax=Aliifodinibius sp. S!AR15-10 TaxID=2950437 RepID=UPI00285BDE92|nr:DUF1080 domain-containing protein [Aliifodinibius sp. S!AR15-10]MDR8389913.1 DUF1080 domain-containing protein [Aliifodinibius sp. S!AR15-10]
MKTTITFFLRYSVIIFGFGVFVFITTSCEKKSFDDGQLETNQSNQINVLTEAEQKNGWELLFDGMSTESWRSTHSQEFPKEGWRVENGILSFVPVENGHGGGDIITKKQYANFELSLEFKIERGGNSGIKYNVVNNYPGHEGNYLGLEYQILDDEHHPDAKRGQDGNRTISSLYDMIPASSQKQVYPEGKWNNARIVVDGNQCEHWLNGDKVVSYNLGSPGYKELVAKSKYHIYENFGEVEVGHILLQAHGDPISFRNIKLRVLPSN